MSYYCCAVPECPNTSINIPGKLWIKVPNVDSVMRNTWLKLARRDLVISSEKYKMYFCEDHFDLENDMENYTQYKLMGSVKRIRMKPKCVPSKFDCQINRKRVSTPSEPLMAVVKRQRMPISQENKENLQMEVDVIESKSCSQDLLAVGTTCTHENRVNKNIQVFPSQEHKAIQVQLKTKFRSKQIQTTTKDTTPFKSAVCTATSRSKISEEQTSMPCTSNVSPIIQKLDFSYKYKDDSDRSCTTSITGSSSPYKPSSQIKTTTDTSSQEDYKKLNLKSTLYKIKNKPKLYIGLPKTLYFLVDLIERHTKINEHYILLCLMKIRLNRTFSQLADDFDLSVTQVSNIFFNKTPEIVKVLSPFIKQFSPVAIRKNLPISFRHKYNKVTCIIDCLEIEIQKPSKALHQALTWSEYKKTNTIKYLIACTPDGLVTFVSAGYAGRISDVNLLEHCKFLECLPPGACILADRGFKHLELLLSQKGFILLRPPSVSAGSKLTKAEAKQTKQIASLRIHVERVIRRLREYSMLKQHSVINSNWVCMLDLCVKTACALINLQDSLIK